MGDIGRGMDRSKRVYKVLTGVFAGQSGSSLWVFQVAYYQREGHSDFEESFGLLKHALPGPRNKQISEFFPFQ